MSKGQKIAMWIISGLLTALFLFAGLPKLLTPAKMLSEWVYAPWFLTFIGVCETLGAIGLLIPRLAALAAAGLERDYDRRCLYTGGASPDQRAARADCGVFLLMLVIFLRRKEGRGVGATAAS